MTQKSIATQLTICLTCQQKTGKNLYDLIQDLAAQGDLEIDGYDCLWSCASACSAQIKAPGKIGYHLGGLEATEDHAAALVAFAEHHQASPSGTVAFKHWPDAIKGHFIARIPPLT